VKQFAIGFGMLAWSVASVAFAQPAQEVDGLGRVDLAKDIVIGSWQKSPDGLTSSAREEKAICSLPYDLGSKYGATITFTRQEGDNVVGVVLPLGPTQVFLEISGWNGETHGLSRVGGSTREESNPTSVRPGTLTNDTKHQVQIEVNVESPRASIQVELDGKPLIDWSGPLADVEPNVAFRTQGNRRLALATEGTVTTFHKVVITSASSVAITAPAMTRPLPAGKVIDLSKINWAEKVGEIGVVDFQGERVVRTKGTDDTVAFLPGVTLDDGTIEVEIASDIFSGIAIRGADTSNYDLLYFRPQNSGTAKHDKTVQYVSKGVPGADWRSLRERFPGKYEAPADINVNEWFHVRIELQGEQLSVYIDDASEPALVVDKMLGERADGKIGLWGWNSHFRNLKFQPSE